MSQYSGAQGRIDFSGARGGVKRPLQKRDPVYPYDRPVSYGSPNGADKSLMHGKDAQDNALIPHDVEHTIWDDIEEALGTPYMFVKDGNGGSGGGRTAPGTALGWSFYSDAEEMPDSELTKYGEESNMWEKIVEAYVSLRDIPEGELAFSQGIEEAELESLMREFQLEVEDTRKYLESCSEAEMVKFLFDLDPEHSAENFAKGGKDYLHGIYNKWVDKIDAHPNDQELNK